MRIALAHTTAHANTRAAAHASARPTWTLALLILCSIAASAACAPTDEAQEEPAAAERAEQEAATAGQRQAMESGQPELEAAEESELRRSAYQIGTKGLVAPVQIFTELPEYTPEATAAGVEGDVYIEAVVTVDGDVVEPKLVRGLADDELNRRALDSITKWKFEPGTKDDEPVPVVALFTVTFRIQ